MESKTYLAIDLKSFYASVECRARGLDPLSTHLVVADASRTEKTICLAVSPSLKQYGIPGRPRLFEVVQRVREINAIRQSHAPNRQLTGQSFHQKALEQDPTLALDYIAAPPQMAKYMAVSTRIYQVYLKYVSPQDIHVYSIDEVFIDATPYLQARQISARQFAMEMIQDILHTTGITATAGIGPNLYLCKVAMDIMAKHCKADANGVRIAELDEISYREQLWNHQPMTDFWRVGHGYAKKLARYGMHTMGDIARCSIHNENLLYRIFGVNAELLIDHAWGWEPCTIADIKSYRPEHRCISSGQVLQCPYNAQKCRIIVREMAELLSLDLLEKGLITGQLTLTIGYDIENLTDPLRRKQYHGPVVVDGYGRKLPKHAHGTANLPSPTSSSSQLVEALLSLYDRIIDSRLLMRRVNINANNVIFASALPSEEIPRQLDLFTDPQIQLEEEQRQKRQLERERKIQEAMQSIRTKFGKNAILKGTSLEDGATTIERNRQIGGHKA